MSDTREMLRDCEDCLKSCAELIKEYSDDDLKGSQIDAINNVEKSIHEIDNNFKKSMQAIEKTKQYFEDENVDSTQKVEDVYNEFLLKESESSNRGTQNIAVEIEENNLLNESVVVSQTPFQIPKDPLTKKNIVDPCRNKMCGHVYEFEIVVSFIKAKNNKAKKCPYVGCMNINLNLNDIEKDNNLKVKITKSNLNVSNISM